MKGAQAQQQLLLFENGDRQLAKLTLRGRLAFQQLRATLVSRRCNGRVAGAWGWGRGLWLAELGIDRLAVERTLLPIGLVTNEGGTLVMPCLDRGAGFLERQRAQGRLGAAARWGDRKTDRKTDRVLQPKYAQLLNRRDAERDGDLMARARARQRSSVDRSVSGSVPDPLSGPPAPSGGPSGSIVRRAEPAPARTGRVGAGGGGRRDVSAAGEGIEGLAPDTPPARVHQVDVRPIRVARTGRSVARLAARAAPNQRDVRPPSAGRAERAGGGPDFAMWWRRFVQLTQKPYRRGPAEQLWADQAMSPGERRSLWRWTEDTFAHYPPQRRTPNAEAFLRLWWPLLRQARAERRGAVEVGSTAELLGEMLGTMLGGAP